MNRKLRTVSAAIILTLALTAGASVVYAYLQNAVEKTNEFRIGADSVEITEEFTSPVSQKQNYFEKTVTVTNTGTSDQYVRLFLDFSDSSVKDRSKIVYTKGGVTKKGTWSEFLADLPTDWEYVPESGAASSAVLGGYFYYTKILAPKSSAPTLITGIETDYGDVTNPDEIRDFDVIVYSESVQTVETKTGDVYNAEDEWIDAWTSFLSRT